MIVQNEYFRGFACVELTHLRLDPMKLIDGNKVQAVTNLFEEFGCKHGNIEHAVPILIDQEVLSTALSNQHVSLSQLLYLGEKFPALRFPTTESFSVMYGDHRLRAAESVLHASEQWWIVALYDSAISPFERERVLQGNHYCNRAPDGRALATILGEHGQEAADLWLSNMSKTRRDVFTRLKEVDQGKLSAKIQQLLRFRGLQRGSNGNWELILTMRCYEASIDSFPCPGQSLTSRQETYSYLDAILSTWKYILGDDVTPDELDEPTVAELYLKTPAYSSHDCEAIKALFTGAEKVIFPSIRDLCVRERIAQRLLKCRRIVTFQSFFEDFRYLGACFDGLKGLLPQRWSRGHESFQATMAEKWNSVRAKRTELQGTTTEDFMYYYVDMWLAGQRDFPSLSDGKASRPLQDKTLVNKKRARPEIEENVRFAYKAYNNYFETSKIKKIMQEHVEIPQDRPSEKRPEVSTHDSALAPTGRSNRPHQGDFDRNRWYLHPVYVFDKTTVERKKYATAFAIARDIIHCCWTGVAGVERWVHQPPLDTRDTATTESTTFVEKPRATLRFKEPGSQRGKGSETGIRRSNRDLESYRQLVQQTPNPFGGTDVVQMSNSFPVSQHIDYEGKETYQTDNTTAHENARNSSFDIADGAVVRILPVQSGIRHAPRFDHTFNISHDNITNGSTAERCDQNDETGNTDRESLTVAPLRWQVRHGLASSQAPSPSEYSDAWTDEVTEAEEHIKSGLDLFEDGSIHKRSFVGGASTGSGEMPQYITDNGEITKHDFKSGMAISPKTTASRKRIPDLDANTNVPVERLSPRVEEFELQELDSSAEPKLPGPDEDRRDENANRGLGSNSKNLNEDNTLNFERDRGLGFKGRRMTEVPDGLGIFPEDSTEREHDANSKRKRGAEEEWKFKSARRAGKFRPQALLQSRVEQHGT